MKFLHRELNMGYFSEFSGENIRIISLKIDEINENMVSMLFSIMHEFLDSKTLNHICYHTSKLLGIDGNNMYIIMDGDWVKTKDLNFGKDLDFIVIDDRKGDPQSIIDAIKIKTKQGDVFPVERYLETLIIFWKTIK